MLIYVGKPHNKLVATQEGTGDNLFDEDIKEGIVDYWLPSVYQQNGEEIVLVDSGQIMTSTLIKDMDMGEKIQRVLEYWDMTDGEYNILEKEEL